MKHILTSIYILIGIMSGLCQTGALLVQEDFQNSPIEEVFEILKTKYELQIAYDYETVAGTIITQHISSNYLESALKQLFERTNLEYQLKDKRLLVRKKNKPTTIDEQLSSIKEVLIQGKVVDGKTGQPLEFATVFEKTGNIGRDADADGRFRINIKTDKKAGELVAQYLGYIPRTIAWKEGDNLNALVIQLEPKTLDFQKITVTETIPTITNAKEAGVLSFNTTHLNTLPSFVGGNDIFRSLQLLPGIGADDDLSAELRIRGSNGDENMVILDGITLYKVDHYFGIFSAVNSKLVNQVTVYKNAFPVEYGGRTSGVVEITTNEVERSKIGAGLEVNLLTSNAYLELPLGTNMNVLLGGRTTNKNVADSKLFGLLEQQVQSPSTTQNFTANNVNIPPATIPNNVTRNTLLAYEPNFSFYDFNGKWTWNLRPSTRISASYFQGYDEFTYEYTQQFTVGDAKRRHIRKIETYDEIANWVNRGWSVQANQKWTKNLTSNLNFSYSGYEEEKEIHSAFTSTTLRRPQEPDDDIDIVEGTEDTASFSNNISNEIKGLDLNLKNEWRIDEQQKVIFGYNFVQNEVAVDLAVDDNSILNGSSPTTTQHAAYAQYTLSTLEDKLEVGLGLRGTHYGLTNKNYWSPRINAAYQATEHLQFKATWSRYNQFLRRIYYEDRFGRNYDFGVMADDKKFPVSSATNWMAGFHFLNNFIAIDMELYHKTTNGILEYALPTVGLTTKEGEPSRSAEYNFFAGDRVSKGIDVLLKKNIRSYSTWLAYTLSETTHSFKGIRRGEPFHSQDDRRHQLKWVNQYTYKKFDFSTIYIFSSGRPYIDFSDLKEDPKDRNEDDHALSYLADYQRVDIEASYRFNLGKTKGNIALSIFNLFNKKNVKYRQYILSVADPEPGSGQNKPNNVVLGTELQMLNFTPNLSFSLSF